MDLRLSDHHEKEARFRASGATDLRRRLVTAYAEMGGQGSFVLHALTPTHKRWVAVTHPERSLQALSIGSPMITPEEAQWLWDAIVKACDDIDRHFCEIDALADTVAGGLDTDDD